MNKPRIVVITTWSAILGAACVVSAPGCEVAGTDIYTCLDPIPHRVDHNGHPDPCCLVDLCHDEDAGDGGGLVIPEAPLTTNCDGECLPAAPLGWSDPALLWFGEEASAPQCPDRAPITGYEGHADLSPRSSSCGSCTCGPPTGTCGLPTTIVANSSQCPPPGSGVTRTPFDPPAGWGGSCTAFDAVQAHATCPGGALCVQSITVGPLLVRENACTPVVGPIAKNSPIAWGGFARACIGTGLCLTNGDVCAPTADASPGGFLQCISHDGDVACPVQFASAYPNKHVFYAGVDDQRTCAACTCGKPAGSQCSAKLSVYEDAVCSMSVLDANIDSTATTCHDIIPAGSALGSKAIGPTTYAPGTCQAAGGEAVGTATLLNPTTFCCAALVPPPH